MKKFRLLSGLLLAALLPGLLLAGCRNRTTSGGKETALELPPSVAASSAPGKVLVRLSPQEIGELKIPVMPVSPEMRTYTLTAPGTVYPAQNHIGIISAPVDGRVLNLPVREGQRVSKGQVVTELESLTYGTLVADYLQAIAEVDLQSNQLERMTKLTEKKISAEADLEKVRADHTRALAGVNAAYARLKTVGVSDAEIDALRSTDRINPRLKVHSPINGVVDSHRAELGQAVAANDVLATVISLDQVLIRAYLAPEDGMLVNPGDTVRISHRLINEKPMIAVVSTINPGLDENNRSMVVNILVDQKDGLLKPGDNVRTEILTRSPAETITVPMDAVTYDNDDPVVFIRLNDNLFEMRRVKIREIANGSAVITNGLANGEAVAVGQVFSLKALSRFKQISEE